MFVCAGNQFDFCANSGFALAINSVTRLLPGSIAPLGPVCSSWIFLSRSCSGRSVLFPIGWESRAWVRSANVMNARVALLVMLISFYGCTFVLEQPVSSLFTSTPSWIHAVRQLRRNGVSTWRQCIQLGAFGGQTQKPLHLYSNNRGLLRMLYRPLTGVDKLRFAANSRLATLGISKAGRKGVTGVKSALRASQRETQLFTACACIDATHLQCLCYIFSSLVLYFN